MATTTADLCARLERLAGEVWASEPADVGRLRAMSRPPMGTLPGVLYACFDLFWLGEEVQALHGLAKAGEQPVTALNAVLGALSARHAVRLSKFQVADMVGLLEDLAAFCAAGGAASHDELRELAEHLLLPLDRVQAWVDRMVPWHELDARLELVP